MKSLYQVDPALWVREVLGMTPTSWQESFLRARRGASILALTARQARSPSFAMAGHEQAAQIAVALFADTAEPVFTPA